MLRTRSPFVVNDKHSKERKKSVDSLWKKVAARNQVVFDEERLIDLKVVSKARSIVDVELARSIRVLVRDWLKANHLLDSLAFSAHTTVKELAQDIKGLCNWLANGGVSDLQGFLQRVAQDVGAAETSTPANHRLAALGGPTGVMFRRDSPVTASRGSALGHMAEPAIRTKPPPSRAVLSRCSRRQMSPLGSGGRLQHSLHRFRPCFTFLHSWPVVPANSRPVSPMARHFTLASFIGLVRRLRKTRRRARHLPFC